MVQEPLTGLTGRSSVNPGTAETKAREGGGQLAISSRKLNRPMRGERKRVDGVTVPPGQDLRVGREDPRAAERADRDIVLHEEIPPPPPPFGDVTAAAYKVRVEMPPAIGFCDLALGEGGAADGNGDARNDGPVRNGQDEGAPARVFRFVDEGLVDARAGDPAVEDHVDREIFDGEAGRVFGPIR